MKGALPWFWLHRNISNLLLKWRTLVWIWIWNKLDMIWQTQTLGKTADTAPLHVEHTELGLSSSDTVGESSRSFPRDASKKLSFLETKFCLLHGVQRWMSHKCDNMKKIFITVSEKGYLWKAILYALPQAEWFLTLTLKTKTKCCLT